MSRALVALSLALLLVRILTAAVAVSQPGFTDAYYYVDVARRIAHGEGLSADFVWNFIEAPDLAPLPVPSHRFWMPLTSLIQAGGITLLEPILGTFRSAQAAIIALAALVPAATYAAARLISASPRAALVAAALAGLGGGAFAPAWVTLDSFAIAATLGTCFFIAFARAAGGDVRWGALAGALVGALYLARAEGAFFGITLLALIARRSSRGAGIAGALAALAIGLAWVARGASLGGTPDLLARTLFLARYEDFFAIAPAARLDAATVVSTRLAALWSDLLVALFSLMAFLALPLAVGARAAWRFPAVRAFGALALLLYAIEALAWPLHATRGSYFHSLAALYPFAMAVVALGGERLIARWDAPLRAIAVAGTIVAAALLAAFGIAQWDAAFNPAYRARLDALAAIPPGPFLAIDAAAWRYIADRAVLVTPADGPAIAPCVAQRYGVRSVVLEEAHFSAYESLYRGETQSAFGQPRRSGAIVVYPVAADAGCSFPPGFRAMTDTGGGLALP